jgi:hypothetical protein
MSFSLSLWSPDANPPMLEIPVRAPGLPVNLWLHQEFIVENFSEWQNFLDSDHNASFKREVDPIIVAPLAVGDTALVGQATVSLAQIRRVEQGVFDTDDWGVSMADWVMPLAAPVVGPATPVFHCQAVSRGKSLAVGATITVDLLVVRASLLRAPPTDPGPGHIRRVDIHSGDTITAQHGGLGRLQVEEP